MHSNTGQPLSVIISYISDFLLGHIIMSVVKVYSPDICIELWKDTHAYSKQTDSSSQVGTKTFLLISGTNLLHVLIKYKRWICVWVSYLVCQHKDCLHGEATRAEVEQILQTGSKQVHD